MAESSKAGNNRRSKREKMRKSPSRAFGDPLAGFTTPTAIRNISTAIDSAAAEIERRLRDMSNSSAESTGDDPVRVSAYIQKRESFVNDLQHHLKEVRKVTIQAYEMATERDTRTDLKRILERLDVDDGAVLRERAALAANRIRIEYGMRGQLNYIKLGESYIMALTQSLPAPSGSSYSKKRSGTEQSSFRSRLIKTYQFEGSQSLETIQTTERNSVWCPISRRYHQQDLMKASHILPCSLGEANVSYLFGMKPSEGYEMLWSERNGLMMHYLLEEKFDDGRMVIVPDPLDNNEFISVVLCEELLDCFCGATQNSYRDSVHEKRLEFQTYARPSKSFLYVQALLTYFRRRRYDVSGWERDRALFSGRIWATPRKHARRSMVEALALEVGDTWDGNIELGAALEDFPDAQTPEDEKKMATVMRFAFESRGTAMEDDEQEDDEQEDDEQEDDEQEDDEQEDDD
ncbi:hypothetical protein RBB50_008058 [Rhinocladiella similis]